jgi:nogalonic acid methyl ester cyclase/aklanonic acid methyl ester cyclase
MNSDREAKHNEMIRALAEQVFSAGRYELLEDILHADYEDHSAPPGLRDRGGFAKIVQFWRDNTSRFDVRVVHLFADGEFVGMVDETTGVHDKNTIFGVAPHGRAFAFQAVHAFRFADGKLRDHWVQTGLPEVIQQWTGGGRKL